MTGRLAPSYVLRMVTRAARVEGGLLGLLVGDALGVPYEFHKAAALPPRSELEFAPPAGFRRAHRSAAPGTWSDDGAQALCLLDSLLACGAFDIEDLARRFVRWYETGYLAVEGKVFDVGVQTSQALRAIAGGVPVARAARTDGLANGNGSLMRVLPLALWHKGDDAELVRDARLQSLVTHAHLRSQLCCALYCLWARAHLEERADPWADATARLRALIAEDEAAVAELEFHIRPDDPADGRGSGYVVDCLRSARMVVAGEGSYEDVVNEPPSRWATTPTRPPPWPEASPEFAMESRRFQPAGEPVSSARISWLPCFKSFCSRSARSAAPRSRAKTSRIKEFALTSSHSSTNAFKRPRASSHCLEMRSRLRRASARRRGSSSHRLSRPRLLARTKPASAIMRRCLLIA